MPKTKGPKVKVVAIRAMATKAMVVAMVGVISRPVVGPIQRMLISIRGFQLIFLREINQGYLVIMSIGLIRLS